MISLFSALLVLMIRKGKIKQALGEVNEYGPPYPLALGRIIIDE